jgi:hypothetical protein
VSVSMPSSSNTLIPSLAKLSFNNTFTFAHSFDLTRLIS